MALGVLGVMMMAAVIGVVATDVEHTADAAPFLVTIDGFRCYINTDNTISIYDVVNEDVTEIIVPESLDGHIVTSITSSGFSGCTELVSVSLPGTLNDIGSAIFRGCSKLTEVVFNSPAPPYIDSSSVTIDTGTTIQVYTPGWDPVAVFFDYILPGTTMVWANPPEYPDLTFLSDPVTDGTITFNSTKTSKTALTA